MRIGCLVQFVSFWGLLWPWLSSPSNIQILNAYSGSQNPDTEMRHSRFCSWFYFSYVIWSCINHSLSVSHFSPSGKWEIGYYKLHKSCCLSTQLLLFGATEFMKYPHALEPSHGTPSSNNLWSEMLEILVIVSMGENRSLYYQTATCISPEQ